MAKVPGMKREQKEQISQYATRIVQLFNTLQRLHPSAAYPDEVKQSDSIRKLLEVLPVADRKWIKISNPAVNTFYEVLKQILVYVDTETNLKLTMDDIEKEQKTKAGTYEVNNYQNATGNKQSSQQAAGNSQSGNTGKKQSSNPNANKTCNYCQNKGHIISECRKKAWAESNNKNSKSQSNKNYNNGNNFKYNPKQNNQGNNNDANKDNTRCSFCNIKGHIIANCRFRQKEAYQNAGNNDNTPWCKYCKCAGHMIADCRKRAYKEAHSSNNANSGNNTNNGNNSGANSNNSNPRRCFRCQDTTHIAKYCNNNDNRPNF